MKKIAVNPYLPAWEYVPDGEPHVFEDRIYVYGSHDTDGGKDFCLEDYVGWSAPVDDPGDWRFEGVIYRRDQEPLQSNKDIFTPPNWAEGELHRLFAPDCVQGKDGRYYLYYSMDFSNIVSVAVSDSPAGPFTFYGHVARQDGTRPEGIQFFDPAVLSEKSGNYLYVGSAPEKHYPGMPDGPIPGAMVMRLADDMRTILSEPVCVANGVETAKGTSFEEHPFFEASSIRHFGKWYYFVYSSLQQHELCYAMSRSPMGPFQYKGVLISNADLGYMGNTKPRCYYGNNHGGLVQLGEKYYIFWHRHTHGGQFSRQGCAEEVKMAPDGTFSQAEMTSCGLNGGPLPTDRSYRASIACCIQGSDRAAIGMLPLLPCTDPPVPYVTGIPQEGGQEGYFSYIANLRPGAAVGYKYFDFGQEGPSGLSVLLRGQGMLRFHLDAEHGREIACVASSSADWNTQTVSLPLITGVHALYMTVEGEGMGPIDIAELTWGPECT